ncbi:MAG: hypothetical protein IT233_10055 [Bacteroidia bacterium]|nr:hypothetical protein [Bacteroidia bacterium]
MWRKISAQLTVVVLSTLLLLPACKNDIDIIADWEETMVIFGILNHRDTAHYVKINKAFLGEEDAFMMAGVYDSVNYANQLTVSLERWRNNQLLSTHALSRDLSVPKSPGIFAYPNQVLFKTTDAIFNDSEYRLKVINSETGMVATAKTNLIGNGFSITEPIPAQNFVNFLNTVSTFKVKWLTGTEGRIYQPVIRFFFVRKNKITGIKTQDSVDWVFREQRSSTLLGGENMMEEFMGELFYRWIGVTVKNPNQAEFLIPGKITDSGHHLDFLLYAGAEEMATYIEVNQPSTTVMMEKPVYTNITNGIGLFSSRTYALKANVELLNTTSRCLDSLFAGQFTYQLGFCTENSLSPYFCQ